MTAGTMRRAAEVLGISQPAVSATIASLEKKIGFMLFSRHAGRLTPTPEAHLFFNEVSRSLTAFELTERAAAEIKKGKRGSLSIVAYPSISIALLSELLPLFMAKRPDVRVNLASSSSYIVKELIPSHQFDLSIAELPTEHLADRTERFSYRCDCILPNDHPLVSRDVITLQDLDNVPFISLFREHATSRQLATAFAMSDANWNIAAEVQYLVSVCELVAAGCGVGVVDPVTSAQFSGSLTRRRFEPAIVYEIGLLYPDRVPSVVAKEFIALLRSRLAFHRNSA